MCWLLQFKHFCWFENGPFLLCQGPTWCYDQLIRIPQAPSLWCTINCFQDGSVRENSRSCSSWIKFSDWKAAAPTKRFQSAEMHLQCGRDFPLQGLEGFQVSMDFLGHYPVRFCSFSGRTPSFHSLSLLTKFPTLTIPLKMCNSKETRKNYSCIDSSMLQRIYWPFT